MPNFKGTMDVLFAEQGTDTGLNLRPLTCLMIIEALTGLIGNALLIFIYARRYRNSCLKYFVLSLSFTDFVTCLTAIPAEIHKLEHWYDYRYIWICKTKSFFNVFTVWSSSLFLLMLAFDRFRKICCPFRWQMRASLVWKLCVISLIVATSVSSPTLIIANINIITYYQNNQTIYVSVCDEVGRPNDGMSILYFILAFISPVSFMVILISIFNILIGRKILITRRQSRATPIPFKQLDKSFLYKSSFRRHSDVILGNTFQRPNTRSHSVCTELFSQNSSYLKVTNTLHIFTSQHKSTTNRYTFRSNRNRNY